MIKKSPIILLDEATSSLDAETENKIQNAINELTKNKTTVVIAHRLSTILNSNIIYVVEKGKIVESGNHNDLLKNQVFIKIFMTNKLENKYTRHKDGIANLFTTLDINHIKPFLIHEWKNISQFIYFTGKNIDNKKVFIKCNGIEDSVIREYQILQELRNNNKEFFPEPYYYRLKNDEKFIVTEFRR